MVVYQQTAAPEVLWPEPMELIWQVLEPGKDLVVRWKRPDIGLSDRLLIGAVVNLPREQRPWGSISHSASSGQALAGRNVCDQPGDDLRYRSAGASGSVGDS